MSRSGSSGIGASYVVLVARTACGRLRGHCPQEGRAARAPERRSLSSPPATRTTSRSRKPGRAARALSSPGREPHHPRRCIHLTEPQQEEAGTEPTSPTTPLTRPRPSPSTPPDHEASVSDRAARAGRGAAPDVTEEAAPLPTPRSSRRLRRHRAEPAAAEPGQPPPWPRARGRGRGRRRPVC